MALSKVSIKDVSEILSGLEPKSSPKLEDNSTYGLGPKTLNELFDITWEESQLYSILKHLNLLSTTQAMIAGGSLVRHLMKTEILRGDIDIFPFKDSAREALLTHFDGEGYKIEKTKFSHSFEFKMGARKGKVQIIHEPRAKHAVFPKFDFEHVRVGYSNGKFFSTICSPTAIAQKKLHLRYVRDPKYSLIRALKYQKMGFDADAAMGTLIHMIASGTTDINACDYEFAGKLVEY
jgi:hypothetical protein